MNIFKNVSFTWWQVGVLKLSVLCFGLAIGAYWSDFFSQYLAFLIGLGLVSALYIGFIWLQEK